MNKNLIEKLSKDIATNILNQPDRKIQPNEPLISNGMIDSFHLVDLALYVEDMFGVIIEDSELNPNTFDTLEELANLIRSRQG